MAEQLVFVYGTLKQGHYNHPCLGTASFFGRATLPANQFQMYDLGAYPALVPSEDGPQIHGELYSANESVMARLDMLEGYPDFYDRKEVFVSQGGELPVKALVYFIHDLGGYGHRNIIESGEW